MTFSNEPVFLNQEIPEGETLEYKSLEPKYLKVKRISFVISLVIFAVVLGFIFYFIEEIQKIWIISLIAGLFLLYAVLEWIADGLSFRYSGYAIREQDLHYRSGWWRRRVRVVPFNRVQHLSIESGMIERRYGLASVAIYTAGASQADFKVKGLKEDTAQELKNWINTQVNAGNEPT
jgi:hypothetical protein